MASKNVNTSAALVTEVVCARWYISQPSMNIHSAIMTPIGVGIIAASMSVVIVPNATNGAMLNKRSATLG